MAAKRKRELLGLQASPGIPSPPDYLILDCSSPIPIESPASIGKTDVILKDEGFNEIIPLTMNGRRIKDDDWSPMQVSPGVSSGYISEPSPSAYLSLTNGREDVSSTCLNAYSPDTVSDSKKKKGSSSRQQEELCLVCGDRASGYHYNALTCEGCKGFFRRSITKSAVYQCKYGGACDIDMYMRRKCQECRLRKCLAVGMRPECVVPEAQCKPKTKPKPKDKDKPNSTTKEASSCGDMSRSSDSPINENKLTADQEELIKKLVFYQGQFELPHDDDIKKLTQFTFTGNEEIDRANRFQHVAELTILTVQLVVESTKRLPGFDTLRREDQITLLKACSSEVMMLRTARRYDMDLDCVVFANNMPYTRENYKVASVGDCTDATFDFCKLMAQLKVANAEYALLTSIVVFSERPNLLEPKKVEKIQEVYLDALRNYVETHRPKGSNIFAKLLMKLTELRSLGNDYSEMLFSLKLQNQTLPPLLSEVMDYNS